ncbi:MAG: SRPBCC domain-containing protein, partial [Candidatus Lokiarchaeota archaeon]|nr:SRPBCC domain-containing protein [Candidatus Lokiarchaeota archaeon]
MENIIHITIELECEVQKVFNLFTVNESLENWLTQKADIDLKLGGKYELFWDPTNKEINSTIGCKITGIEKNRFISFDWKGPVQFKSFMNVADPLT